VRPAIACGPEEGAARITQLESRIVEIPVRSPYVFSHGVLKAFSNVLVWIHTDEKIIAIGESSYFI